MSRIKLHPSGHEIECQQGDTVLAAVERSGYALPNNCRAGACGECKVKVLQGEFDQGIVLDMALSQEERAQGFGLMCMAKPLSDELVIEWGTDDAKPKLFPPRENMLHIVTDKIRRTPRITEFRFRPLGNPVRYWPGQYVMLGDATAGAPQRSYSIAGAPRPDGEILLHVTRDATGATSRWLHDQVQVGDSVKLSGAYGTFIGDPSVETPVLCMAAGSGLAPILSLTEAALRRGFKQPVKLLFSACTAEDIYNQGLMTFLQAKNRRFKFIPTLTREKRDGMLSGRIPDLLPTQFTDLSGYTVFIAGTPEFVASCKQAAKLLGAKDEMIHTEGYFQQQQPETPPANRLATASAGR
ncbi:MAG: 2Fe-2S iron-sulfur cluster binding domain-containing protein [Polaromonas sp.]|uniref:2Fe-2S iron-sulfur cluster-binding protein n=1 Tax=Polaromonas sp. TaxID=1869339 RepID=UPI00179BACA2|nr:2Fe-2S iron-sulfur cluster-binding protein [Polaromonas sp.]NMM11453.1 2Fe-2S iron-sulfur cluster binding domain-containing protein [Polaromonas sp.]